MFLFQAICHIVPKKDKDDNKDPTTILAGIEQIVKELEKGHSNDL